MARLSTAKGKVVRRLGVNVFGNPKYDRLLTRRPNPPGIHGASAGRKRVSEYGRQLLEKQKLRFSYGLSEKQFRKTFEKALGMKGVTSANLLSLLERRLDNAVYRSGFAPTRTAARQLVSHGHIMVNGRRTNVPSYQVREGDVIAAKDRKASQALVDRNIKESSTVEKPLWIELDAKKLEASITRLPDGNEVQSVADLQMIIELYSK